MEEHNYANDCSQCGDPGNREVWACDKPFVDELAGDQVVYHVGGKDYHTCPLKRLQDPAIQTCLHLFEAYENGHLPQQGSLAEQPELYCTMMAHISALRSSVRSYQHKKHKEQNKP